MYDHVEMFTLKDGRQVEIGYDEMSNNVAIYAKVDGERKQVGAFAFDTDIYEDGLKMISADIKPEWKRNGIGTRVLEVVAQQSGEDIWTQDADGMRQDDGSHLTGDAPAFVSAMKARGLIRKSVADYPDPDDEY